MLELVHVSKALDGETAIDDACLTLTSDSINILLGPTRAGKTSLMRLMAGLDAPDAGDIRFAGESVLGKAVQQRQVAMVYQQFINYPSLRVFDNIASPLRLARLSKTVIAARVNDAATLLGIDKLLDRTPQQLSGGQQQRVALARALVKRAKLVLLDEPLANLDYKLREELRSQLPDLFAEQGALLVYATTEPLEALQLGGRTCVLHEGRVRQFGATLDVFQRPQDIITASVFSDPPFNTAAVRKLGDSITLGSGQFALPTSSATLGDGNYILGVRPYHLGLEQRSAGQLALPGQVSATELSGSESFIHFDFDGGSWLSLVHAIVPLGQGDRARFFLDPKDIYLFHSDGRLAHCPARAESR
jgi:glycerol transport system ATP-binding protein